MSTSYAGEPAATVNAELVARVERLPVTRRLLLIRIIIDSATFFDAYTVLVIAFAMPSLVEEWSLTPAWVGLILRRLRRQADRAVFLRLGRQEDRPPAHPADHRGLRAAGRAVRYAGRTDSLRASRADHRGRMVAHSMTDVQVAKALDVEALTGLPAEQSGEPVATPRKVPRTVDTGDGRHLGRKEER
ncbi:MAG TPA: hypothetical protein VNP92_10135 [Actinophytocola sp.]|nr:hypothetical protein [Actinophytocola sp.]